MTAIVAETAEQPIYRHIGDEASHLRDLGLSDRKIARSLDVSDKTVAKAIRRATGRS